MVLLIDVPSVMYVGVEGTIVVKVSDGFDWVLSVDSTEVDSGTGTGENQDATFTPTAEMEGRSVEVLLTGTGETDEDDTRIIAIYDSAWINVPAYMYIGKDNTVQLRATAGAQWLIYLNDKYATWGIGTGATQSVTLVPTFDYEGLNQDADLRVLSLEDTENTSIVDGYILEPVSILYVGIEGNVPVRVTEDLIWSMYVNGVTAAYTQSGLGADQDCIFTPSTGMEGKDVTISLHYAGTTFDLLATVVDARIETVPDALYVGLETDITIYVTDGYGWSLTVAGIEVGTGDGTGANQAVTFTPTAEMLGEHIEVLLTAGEKTDVEYIDAFNVYDDLELLGNDSASRAETTDEDFGINYVMHDGYNRKMIVWVVCKATGITSAIDYVNCHATEMTLAHHYAGAWINNSTLAWHIYCYYCDEPAVGETVLIQAVPSRELRNIGIFVEEWGNAKQGALELLADMYDDAGYNGVSVVTELEGSALLSCIIEKDYLATTPVADSGQTVLDHINLTGLEDSLPPPVEILDNGELPSNPPLGSKDCHVRIRSVPAIMFSEMEHTIGVQVRDGYEYDVWLGSTQIAQGTGNGSLQYYPITPGEGDIGAANVHCIAHFVDWAGNQQELNTIAVDIMHVADGYETLCAAHSYEQLTTGGNYYSNWEHDNKSAQVVSYINPHCNVEASLIDVPSYLQYRYGNRYPCRYHSLCSSWLRLGTVYRWL
jgi:hypothetical protein